MEKQVHHEDISTTHYQGVFQYTDGVMDFIHTAEGYTKVTHSEENIPYYNYVFNYTDHLGNVRVSWTQNPEAPEELVIIDDNHYYPFGLRHKGYQSHPQVHYWATSFQQVALTTVSSLYPESYKYKYNGKEFQGELSLNLYDFGFRNYDPALGRWMNIDPLAERRHELNPYNYVQNSPLFRFDPDGLTDFTLDKKTGEVKQVGDKNDEPDRILKTNNKGEVKKKGEGFLGFLVRKSEKGKEKVAVDGIDKNILEDGQNYKNEGVAFEVGGEGNPTQEGIEKFSVQLSNYLGKEVGGAYASTDGSSVTHMTIGAYKGNTRSKLKGGFAIGELSRSLYPTSFSLLGNFHVHPGGTRSPSPRDNETKDSWKDKYKSFIFNILIKNPQAKNGYESIPYEN